MSAALKNSLAAPVRFGPFRLLARERVLLREGRPVSLGSRALDLLIALVGNAGRAVSKRELLAMVWPDVAVEEGSLRGNVVALRRALADEDGGTRYIATLPGRGYCFVADVTSDSVTQVMPRRVAGPAHNLPSTSGDLLGRDEAIQTISQALLAKRFVTIVGPGGIGKTSVAIALGHALLETFAKEVCFVDLGAVGDPTLAGSAVALALGVPVRTADASAAIVAFLGDRRRLLILDCCEHVVDVLSVLAEQIHKYAPGAYILATSREALRVDGERVHRLPVLAAPSDSEKLNANEALTFPAVQLFVKRVAADDGAFELVDEDAPIVAGICRDLDGMPLAIELAAGRVGAYGLAETARLLGGRFALEWTGRRTAHPRHRTLAATLDWSYALLLKSERRVLPWLAIFVGGFHLDAIRAVAPEDLLDGASVLDALAGLVAKSLVVVKARRAGTVYRLLDATRSYAFQKLTVSGEHREIARRHAAHLRDWLPLEHYNLTGSQQVVLADRDIIGNLRAALEWCFSAAGDADIGVDLAAAAAPFFLRLSLLTECMAWTERALASLDNRTRGTRQEMHLQASLGVSMMFTDSNSGRVLDALERSLAIAEQNRDVTLQVRLFGWINVVYLRRCQFRDALVYAQRGAHVARQLGDRQLMAASDAFVGSNYNLLGRNVEAEMLLTESLARGEPAGTPVQLGFSTRNHAMTSLAMTFWIRGRPDQAVALALETIEEASRLGHPSTLCIALLYSISVLLWAGDFDQAEACVDDFIAQATRYSMTPYLAAGMGVKGELAIRRGRVEEGVATLQSSIDALQRGHYQRRMTALSFAIADGFAALGRFDEALAIIDGALERGERDGDLVAMPEMLRTRGEILGRLPHADPREGEATIQKSLEMARMQGALSWELRSATSLARLWMRQNRFKEAHTLLSEVYGQFVEGFLTADLLAAKGVLDELTRRSPHRATPPALFIRRTR